MAQSQPERNMEAIRESPGSLQNKEQTHNEMNNVVTTTYCSSDAKTSHHSGSIGLPFKFNVQAPEFVLRSHSNGPQNGSPASANASTMRGYFYPWFNYLGLGPDWLQLGDQRLDPGFSASTFFLRNASVATLDGCSTKNTVITDDLRQKIVKQVEYQFSDMSLLANEFMSRHISKDPEGYDNLEADWESELDTRTCIWPYGESYSVAVDMPNFRGVTSNINLLTQALYSSSKLVVSDNAKKVKRKVPFSDKDREELQARTVAVENLPEDYSHQNLEKICSVVGNVKTIRICHPRHSNSLRSKSDLLVSNKIYALVEFESSEIAEKAAEQLSDERDWRTGLRVRLLLRYSPKSVLKTRSEFNGIQDDEVEFPDLSDGFPQHNMCEPVSDSNAEDSSAASKNGWGKDRGKGKGRGQVNGCQGLIAPSPLLPAVNTHLYDPTSKPPSRGPRMPDGTKGFTMGRGKPLGSPTRASPVVVE